MAKKKKNIKWHKARYKKYKNFTQKPVEDTSYQTEITDCNTSQFEENLERENLRNSQSVSTDLHQYNNQIQSQSQSIEMGFSSKNINGQNQTNQDPKNHNFKIHGLSLNNTGHQAEFKPVQNAATIIPRQNYIIPGKTYPKPLPKSQNYSDQKYQNRLIPSQNYQQNYSSNLSPKIEKQIYVKDRHHHLTVFQMIFGTGLFLASVTFWLFSVQPIILEKITDIYSSKNGYITQNQLEANKQIEKIDQVLKAGQTDIKNIKNLACSNNNAELNIKKFENVNYKVLPKDEAVISGFRESQVDKIYLDYVVSLNLKIEDYLLNKDIGKTANDIQSLNNFSVNCARSVEKYSGEEDEFFKEKVCEDLNLNLTRFGVADSFSLNKLCQKDGGKAQFLEDLDKFIEQSADNIKLGENDKIVYQEIDELRKDTESKITNYYNQKIKFPGNIYLLRAK